MASGRWGKIEEQQRGTAMSTIPSQITATYQRFVGSEPILRVRLRRSVSRMGVGDERSRRGSSVRSHPDGV
jgi:hypothetical protein